MTEVFIVTSGDYSAYGIDGVFSTRPLAEAAIGDWNDVRLSVDEYKIETWVLDDAAKIGIISSIAVELSFRGDVLSLTPNRKPHTSGWFSFGSQPAFLTLDIATGDINRAVKVAAEKWATIKATIAWGDTEALRELLGQEKKQY